MPKIDVGLDDIEINAAVTTLLLALIPLVTIPLINNAIENEPLEDYLTTIHTTFLGIAAAILFLNFKAAVQRKRFKEVYFRKFLPTLRRLFHYIYIELSHLGKLNNVNAFENYKIFLESHNELLLHEGYFNRYSEHYEVFNIYREKLASLIAINSALLPHNLVLQSTQIIERLDSLALQLRLKDKELVLKNVKAILRHFKFLDDAIFKLRLNEL